MGAITDAASAKPIALPAPGASEVILGLPSEKVLWGILFGNAVAVIVYLWKTIRDTEKEDIKEIKQALKALSALPQDVHEMKGAMKNLPTRETVEIMIWKHLKEHK